MEIPRHWRLISQRVRGPGNIDQNGDIWVNGKIFDSQSGEVLSPVEISLRTEQEIVAVGVMALSNELISVE